MTPSLLTARRTPRSRLRALDWPPRERSRSSLATSSAWMERWLPRRSNSTRASRSHGAQGAAVALPAAQGVDGDAQRSRGRADPHRGVELLLAGAHAGIVGAARSVRSFA